MLVKCCLLIIQMVLGPFQSLDSAYLFHLFVACCYSVQISWHDSRRKQVFVSWPGLKNHRDLNCQNNKKQSSYCTSFITALRSTSKSTFLSLTQSVHSTWGCLDHLKSKHSTEKWYKVYYRNCKAGYSDGIKLLGLCISFGKVWGKLYFLAVPWGNQ